ncbi:MAG: hypothetical protein ACR2QK_11625 [Acidimicrobiales bacterium]
MDLIELMGALLGSYASPELFVIAAAAVGVLVTGLGARIIEFANAVGDGLTDRTGRTPTTVTLAPGERCAPAPIRAGELLHR